MCGRTGVYIYKHTLQVKFGIKHKKKLISTLKVYLHVFIVCYNAVKLQNTCQNSWSMKIITVIRHLLPDHGDMLKSQEPSRWPHTLPVQILLVEERPNQRLPSVSEPYIWKQAHCQELSFSKNFWRWLLLNLFVRMAKRKQTDIGKSSAICT